MADQGQDTNPAPHILVAYKRYYHVKVVMLGKSEAETPVVKWIMACEDSTFADIKEELFDAGIPDATVLRSHYGLKPFWTEPDPKSKIGAMCQTLYAVRGEGLPFIIALVRRAEANYPVAIFDFKQHPLEAAFAFTESTSEIEKEEVSIIWYSSEDLVCDYDSYESLKSQEASTFPTCFIITIGEMPSQFQDDMLPQAMLPFLLNPFYDASALLRRAYALKRFPRQAIHVTGALLHAIITLAGVSRMSQTTLDKPGGEPILTNQGAVLDNLRLILSDLERILDTIEKNNFDISSNNISKLLDDCFMELCGEYPGAVIIRNSYAILQKLKALDQETTGMRRPRVAKAGGGVRKPEKKSVISKISWNLIRRKNGE